MPHCTKSSGMLPEDLHQGFGRIAQGEDNAFKSPTSIRLSLGVMITENREIISPKITTSASRAGCFRDGDHPSILRTPDVPISQAPELVVARRLREFVAPIVATPSAANVADCGTFYFTKCCPFLVVLSGSNTVTTPTFIVLLPPPQVGASSINARHCTFLQRIYHVWTDLVEFRSD
ncbi:hypothetical protein F511_16737 [Dorcoceras hygrometricum]|uniref:Uncharacterized protein n=1 Tax=Dorcoceras hygrometricum TaxID=472368 RepID=A0A2Z7B9F5_9LAMI|nr:hypothetical protein F511_16737 [Dorcoceras hygrometricum]